MRNYYKVLGISESATDTEIRQAYRKLAALHHPDHNPHDPLAQLEMKMINAAYDVLSDPIKRADYDRINNFRRAPSEPQADGSFPNGTSGSQNEYLQPSSPAPQHNPFSMGDDQAPRHPENITNILWAMQNPDRDSITSCMKNVLWIDLFVSIIYFIYYLIMRSHLPIMLPGSNILYSFGAGMYRLYGVSWMARFTIAAYLELAASIFAIYWMKRTRRSNFLKYYLFIKSYVFISIAAAFFGLTTVDTSIFIPATVASWKLFLMFSLFISRLEQVLWRFRER